MQYVLDFDGWRPDPAMFPALHAAGVVGFNAYLGPQGWPKVLTPEQLHLYLDNGFSIQFSYETTVNRWRTGYAGGVSDGQACAQYFEVYGLGHLAPYILVKYAFDQELLPQDFDLGCQYLRGCKDGSRALVDAYAEGAFTEYAFQRGFIQGIDWQSESTGFLGNAQPQPHTALRQIYNQKLPGVPGDYDINEVLMADWGQFPRPQNVSQVQQEDDRVILTPRLAVPTIDTKGKVPEIYFDRANKTLQSFGYDFVRTTPGWEFSEGFGLVLAKLTVPTTDDAHPDTLSFDETPDGRVVYIWAEGDRGTFKLPYAKVLQNTAPQAVNIDYADIAQHLSAQAVVTVTAKAA